ncbi:hypothetical protein [Candidatus Entotheonella palauensis]|uniref:hypothetical protein n=1 Tax=Candidatus Entotheonella palauensis TaxID=93172 RepID=UPI000B7E0A1B|nr:hypothetical protein [Candidatus Entotheonella palauensis]
MDQIEHHGTPFRIDGPTETYYVLSADQLMALLRNVHQEIESVEPFTPQDFELTEADLSVYKARREARRKRINRSMLVPLETDLEQHLRQLTQVQQQFPISDQQKHKVDQLLNELETVMGNNVQTAAKKAK